jgi:hypothetical protein
MRFRLAIIVFPALLARHATAQISVPQPGPVRYSDGVVRMIGGIPGALIPQPAALGRAARISFSNSAGLWASPGEIRLVDASLRTLGSYPTDEEAPVLNTSGGPQTAAAWLPESHTLLTWTGKVFAAVEVDTSLFEGTVSSVSLTSAKTARLFVADAKGVVSVVRIALPSGTVQSVDILPDVHGSAWSFGPLVISIAGREMALDSPDGTRRMLLLADGALPKGGAVVAERMSDHWLHLRSVLDGREWALFMNGPDASIWQIPPVSSAAVIAGNGGAQ